MTERLTIPNPSGYHQIQHQSTHRPCDGILLASECGLERISGTTLALEYPLLQHPMKRDWLGFQKPRFGHHKLMAETWARHSCKL